MELAVDTNGATSWELGCRIARVKSLIVKRVALTEAQSNNGMHPTRNSVPFIENLSLPQLCAGG